MAAAPFPLLSPLILSQPLRNSCADISVIRDAVELVATDASAVVNVAAAGAGGTQPRRAAVIEPQQALRAARRSRCLCGRPSADEMRRENQGDASDRDVISPLAPRRNPIPGRCGARYTRLCLSLFRRFLNLCLFIFCFCESRGG